MRLDVLAEMVAPHEALVTLRADEAFLAGVRAEVALELVRTREALPTVEPMASKRTFSSMPAKMSTEMRRLSVHFATVGMMADVLLFLRRTVDVRLRIGSTNAVRASASHASYPSRMRNGLEHVQRRRRS